jgi:tetrachloro-p-hydroquinone reductive dehalogenase
VPTKRVLLYDFAGSICCQMTRLTLAEKGVRYEKHPVDISNRREQFEPWYLKLNPKGVVPTLAIDDEVITDTMNITPRIDADFDGPALTPADPDGAANMRQRMVDIMAVRYGVLLYSRQLDDNRKSSVIMGRAEMLRNLREERPDAKELFDARIEGNARLQKTLADPEAVQAVVDSVQGVIGNLEAPLERGAFLSGARYSIADAFATAALARLDLHGFSGWWTSGKLPNVERYYHRMVARPSFREAGVVNRE